MKKLSSKLFLVLLMCFGLLSCNNSDDDESITSNNGPWEIEYSITGVSGEFTGTYRSSDGSFQAVKAVNVDGSSQDMLATAPWKLNFTTTDDNAGAQVSVTGFEGIPGETATLKILVDGVDAAENYRRDGLAPPVFGNNTYIVEDSGEWAVSLVIALDNLNN